MIWAALDGGGDPDWISSTDAQQIVDHHIDGDGRSNCQIRNISGNISKGWQDIHRKNIWTMIICHHLFTVVRL